MINKYIDFIIEEIINDSIVLDLDYGFNIILLPYVYWLFYFLFKYGILTLPFWLPLNILLGNIKRILHESITQIKK